MANLIMGTDSKIETARGVRRWAGQMIISLLIYGVILFGTAGRLNWGAGWWFLGLNLFTMVLSAVLLIRRRPELLAERSKVREGTKGWDRILTPSIAILGPVAIIITAGLDARCGWSVPIGYGWRGIGFILALGSQIFVLWAMVANPFFATTVRIQDDRGHRVISGGPYQLVRHPGYLGSLVYNLACPPVLNSRWTFLPAALTILLLIIRTGLEDRMLREELPDYLQYAETVRYRLIPGIW